MLKTPKDKLRCSLSQESSKIAYQLLKLLIEDQEWVDTSHLWNDINDNSQRQEVPAPGREQRLLIRKGKKNLNGYYNACMIKKIK